MDKKQVFPIEKKLETIEWKLEIIKASVASTHTPLRTLKSMIESDVVLPTREHLKSVGGSSALGEKLAKVLHL